ncbi:DNA-binding protein [Mycobacterium hodleri]|uniref:DNA-binding protein n=1 Tax=Mycolicibacterium hodleri TaxID=49897 RepID=UPI0021F30CEB|nr:DNA-binding protein [Mycolicibacterium hodleri]MCV7136157.1 DNA-binding protein [Mycolicibacterium hodleri]
MHDSTNTDDEPDELLWSYQQTSAKMGDLSQRGVSRLADRGEITRIHVGKRAFIVAASVREYVARRMAQG